MRYDQKFYVRVSQDDLDALDSARGDMTRSAFLRAAMHASGKNTRRAAKKPPTERTASPPPSSERSSPAHLHASVPDGRYYHDRGVRYERRECAVCAVAMPSRVAP